jgi:hypothetical protein
MPTGAQPVPINPEGKCIVGDWDFHYQGWEEDGNSDGQQGPQLVRSCSQNQGRASWMVTYWRCSKHFRGSHHTAPHTSTGGHGHPAHSPSPDVAPAGRVMKEQLALQLR